MPTSSSTVKLSRRRALPIADRLLALTAEVRAGRHVEVPLPLWLSPISSGCELGHKCRYGK
jgi:hypothetical protein